MFQMRSNSVIWTDEHRSYACLKKFEYIHDMVYQKSEFINKITGFYTQVVESFNNHLKYHISMGKGIKTESKQFFLNKYVLISITNEIC